MVHFLQVSVGWHESSIERKLQIFEMEWMREFPIVLISKTIWKLCEISDFSNFHFSLFWTLRLSSKISPLFSLLIQSINRITLISDKYNGCNTCEPDIIYVTSTVKYIFHGFFAFFTIQILLIKLFLWKKFATAKGSDDSMNEENCEKRTFLKI